MTTFDERPPRFAGSVSVVAALIAVVLTLPGGSMAFGVAVLGLTVLASGAFRGHRGFVSIGGLLVVAGAFVSAAFGAPVATVLAAVGSAFVAWDVGEYGIGLGLQVGHAARSRHAVVTHTAGSVIVAGVTTIVGTVVYSMSPGGRPFAALVLLLVGAVVITAALTD